MKPYINNRNFFTYRDRLDICITCGQQGGSHYTNEGISYCFKYSDRIEHEDDPKYQTSFTYSIENSITKKDNPNSTFKRRIS